MIGTTYLSTAPKWVVGLLVLVAVSTGHAQTFDPLSAHDDLLAEATGFFAQAGGMGGKGGTVHFVTNLNDAGPGSLRDALTRTEPLIILFEDGIDGRIDISSGDIEIQGSKTIWGRHRDGSAADIYVHPVTKSTPFSIKGTGMDVIIANLKGDAPGPNDNAPDLIGISGQGNKVWVHHVYAFGDGTGNMDGFVDTGKQSTGADNIMLTVSWCRVQGWDNVFGIKSNAQVTFHHNYLLNNNGRHPKTLETAKVHAYNNWLENWGYQGMKVEGSAEIRAENNVFKAGGDNLAIEGRWAGSGNAFLNGATASDPSLGVFTPSYSYSPDPVGTAAEQQALQDLLGAGAGWVGELNPPDTPTNLHRTDERHF